MLEAGGTRGGSKRRSKPRREIMIERCPDGTEDRDTSNLLPDRRTTRERGKRRRRDFAMVIIGRSSRQCRYIRECDRVRPHGANDNKKERERGAP